MQVVMIDKNTMVLPGTHMGLLYVPQGMRRDYVNNRWVIVLEGITKEFKDSDGFFGALESLARAYIYTMENGENKHLPKLNDRFTEFGVQGIYRRGGLNPHYLVRVYGKEEIIKLGKVEKREAQQALRLKAKLDRMIPAKLIQSFEMVTKYV